MKILIGTPTYNQALTTQYHESVVAMFKHFHAKHPDIEFDSCIRSLSLINKTRNFMASLVLANPSYSHLLFIDADMGFQPALIEDMIRVNKPIVGTIYPYRMLDVEKLHAASRRFDDPAIAWMVAQDYICGNSVKVSRTEVGGGQAEITLNIEHGCVQASHAGTGIMLIQRETFVKMRALYPDLYLKKDNGVYPSLGLEEGILQVFESLIDDNGLYLPEDISFCKRWTMSGGEIWAHINSPIAHVGPAVFAGHFLTKFQHTDY